MTRYRLTELSARIAGFCLLAATYAWSAQQYSASGLVLRVDRTSHTLAVSVNDIPGYMEAMAMSFSVPHTRDLEGLTPGTIVDFTLVVDKESSHVENVKIRTFEDFNPEPTQASRLSVLEKVLEPESATAQLSLGQTVPDFILIDQNHRKVSLREFAGQVIAVDFVYTRCPLPDYCYRFSNNFGRLQKRFADRLGHELVLLTITFDPVHDQPETLAAYAKTWKASSDAWHFLTGPTDDVRRVCGWFGVQFWADESAFTHTLHTIVIDRQGKLVANIEGNQYTAEQLGDLLETVMTGGRASGTQNDGAKHDPSKPDPSRR